MKWGVVLWLCFLVTVTFSAKILVITTMPAHSHFTLTAALAKELARRGHDVTFVSPYPGQLTAMANLAEVSLAASIPPIEEIKKGLFNTTDQGPLSEHLGLSMIGDMTVTMAFENPNLRKLLDSKNAKNGQFSAVLVEQFANEAVFGIAAYFGAPLIVLAPIPPCHVNNYLSGNPAPASYVPNIYGPYMAHMSFFQRLHNLIDNKLVELARHFYHLPKQSRYVRQYLTGDIDLDTVLSNVSLVLTTSHTSVNDPVPTLPNVIEIGGHHIDPPKPLPEDLQEYLDRSGAGGVVVFSMGSNLKSADLRPEFRRAILRTFGRIPHVRVLWKFETELADAPANVKVVKWLPQQDVLAHPNVKVFITHGGLLSTLEAIHHGVPLFGIPVFGDQKSNMKRAVHDGYAVSVPLNEISEESLFKAMTEILSNPRYKENAARRSRLMKDQPLKPLDTAMFWIEHVTRHGGGSHLRSAALDLTFYQRDMLDITAFLVLILLVSVVLLSKLVKCVYRAFGNKAQSVDKKKKNK